MGTQKAAGGSKNRKWGRDKDWCKAYALRHQREKNKVKRLVKHIARQPNDACGFKALQRAKDIISGKLSA